MKKFIEKFNAFCANRLSIILSSMWLFWALAIVLLVLGIINPMGTVFDFVMYWISAVFQAIALPVLAFVSNIQGEKQQKVMKETHDAVVKEMRLLRQENAELKELLLHKHLGSGTKPL